MSEINVTSEIKNTELSGDSKFQSDTTIDHPVVNKTENNIDHQTVHKHINTNASTVHLSKMLEKAQSSIETLTLSNASLVAELNKERDRNYSKSTEIEQLRKGLVRD
mgnify:CR=1 FL=1